MPTKTPEEIRAAMAKHGYLSTPPTMEGGGGLLPDRMEREVEDDVWAPWMATKSVYGGITGMLGGTIQGFGIGAAWAKDKIGLSGDPEDNFIYDAGSFVKEDMGGEFYVPSRFQSGWTGFLARDLPQGVGSAVGFVATGFGEGKALSYGLGKLAPKLTGSAAAVTAEVKAAEKLARTRRLMPVPTATKARVAAKEAKREKGQLQGILNKAQKRAEITQSAISAGALGVTGGMVQGAEGWADASRTLHELRRKQGRDVSADDIEMMFDAYFANIPGGAAELFGVELPIISRLLRGAKGTGAFTKADYVTYGGDKLVKQGRIAAGTKQLMINLEHATGGRFSRGLTSKLARIGASGAQEFAQEAGQSAWFNMVANNMVGYDVNRDLMEGVMHEGGVGGAIGVMFGLASVFLNKKVRLHNEYTMLRERGEAMAELGNEKAAKRLFEKADRLEKEYNAMATNPEAVDEEIKQAEKSTAPVALGETAEEKPVFGATPHHTYAVELDREEIKKKLDAGTLEPAIKKQLKDYDWDSNKPLYYVGSTNLLPEERTAEHLMEAKKAGKGVHKYGVGYVEGVGSSFAGRKEAEAGEVQLAGELKGEGYGILGGGPATTTRSDKSKPVTKVFGKPAAKGRHAPTVKQVAAAEAAGVELSDIELTGKGQVTKTRLQRAIDAKSVPAEEEAAPAPKKKADKPAPAEEADDLIELIRSGWPKLIEKAQKLGLLDKDGQVIGDVERSSEANNYGGANRLTEGRVTTRLLREAIERAETKTAAAPAETETAATTPAATTPVATTPAPKEKSKPTTAASKKLPKTMVEAEEKPEAEAVIEPEVAKEAAPPAKEKEEADLEKEVAELFAEKEVEEEKEAEEEPAAEEGEVDEFGFPAAKEDIITEEGQELADRVGKLALGKGKVKFAAFAQELFRISGGEVGMIPYIARTYERLRDFQDAATKKAMDSASAVKKNWPGIRNLLESEESVEEKKSEKQTETEESVEAKKKAKKKPKKKKALTPAQKKEAILARRNAKLFGLELPKSRVLTQDDVIEAMGKDVDRSLIFFNPDGTSVLSKGAGEPASLQDLTEEEVKEMRAQVKHLERLIELDGLLTNTLTRRNALVQERGNLLLRGGHGEGFIRVNVEGEGVVSTELEWDRPRRYLGEPVTTTPPGLFETEAKADRGIEIPNEEKKEKRVAQIDNMLPKIDEYIELLNKKLHKHTNGEYTWQSGEALITSLEKSELLNPGGVVVPPRVEEAKEGPYDTAFQARKQAKKLQEEEPNLAVGLLKNKDGKYIVYTEDKTVRARETYADKQSENITVAPLLEVSSPLMTETVFERLEVSNEGETLREGEGKGDIDSYVHGLLGTMAKMDGVGLEALMPADALEEIEQEDGSTAPRGIVAAVRWALAHALTRGDYKGMLNVKGVKFGKSRSRSQYSWRGEIAKKEGYNAGAPMYTTATEGNEVFYIDPTSLAHALRRGKTLEEMVTHELSHMLSIQAVYGVKMAGGASTETAEKARMKVAEARSAAHYAETEMDKTKAEHELKEAEQELEKARASLDEATEGQAGQKVTDTFGLMWKAVLDLAVEKAADVDGMKDGRAKRQGTSLLRALSKMDADYHGLAPGRELQLVFDKDGKLDKKATFETGSNSTHATKGAEWIALLIRWHLNPNREGEAMPSYVSNFAAKHSTGNVLGWFKDLTNEELGLKKDDTVPVAVQNMFTAAEGLKNKSNVAVQRAEHLNGIMSGHIDSEKGLERSMLEHVMAETALRIAQYRAVYQHGFTGGTAIFAPDVTKQETPAQKRARGVTVAQEEIRKVPTHPWSTSGETHGGEPAHFDHLTDGIQLSAITDASEHAELIGQLPGGVIVEPRMRDNQVKLEEHIITIGGEWMQTGRSWVKVTRDETVDQIAETYNTTSEVLLRNNPVAAAILERRSALPNGTRLLMHGQIAEQHGGAAPSVIFRRWLRKSKGDSKHKHTKRDEAADAVMNQWQAKVNALNAKIEQAMGLESRFFEKLSEARAELEEARAAIWTGTWEATFEQAKEKVARFEEAHKAAQSTSLGAAHDLDKNREELKEAREELRKATEFADGAVKEISVSKYNALSRKDTLISLASVMHRNITPQESAQEDGSAEFNDTVELQAGSNDSAADRDSLVNDAQAAESAQQEFANIFSESWSMALMDELGLGISTRDLSYLLELISKGHPVSGSTVAGVSAVETKGRIGAGITAAKGVQTQHNRRVEVIRERERKITVWESRKERTTDPAKLAELDSWIEGKKEKNQEDKDKFFDGGVGRPIDIIELEAEDTRRMLDAIGQMLLESKKLKGFGAEEMLGLERPSFWAEGTLQEKVRAGRREAYERGGLRYFRDLAEPMKMQIIRRMISSYAPQPTHPLAGGEVQFEFPSVTAVSDKIDNIFERIEEARLGIAEEHHRDPRKSRAVLAAEEQWKVEHRTHEEVVEAVKVFENILINGDRGKVYNPNQTLTDTKATLDALNGMMDEIISLRTRWDSYDVINLQTAIIRAAQFLKDHKNWNVGGVVRELDVAEAADIETFHEKARQLFVELNSDSARTLATQTSRNQMLGNVAVAYGYLNKVLEVQHKHFGNVIDAAFLTQVVELINVASATAAEKVVNEELLSALENTGLEGAKGDIADLIRASAAAFEIDNAGKQRDYVVPNEFKKKFNELLEESKVTGSISPDDMYILQTHVYGAWRKERIKALKDSLAKSGLAKGKLTSENLMNSAEQVLKTRDLGRLTVPRNLTVKIPGLAKNDKVQKTVTNLWDAVAPAQGIGFSNDKAAQKLAEINRKIEIEGLTPAEASDLRQRALNIIMEESWIDPWNLATDLWFSGALSGLRTFGDITFGGIVHGVATTLGAAVKSSVYGSTSRLDGFDMGMKYIGGLWDGLMGAGYIVYTGDLSKLPDANARLMERMKSHDYYGGESLEAKARQYKARGLAWYHPYRIHSNLKIVRRLVLALDYVGATAGRRAMILYGASTRLAEAVRKGAPPEAIASLNKAYKAAKTLNHKDKKARATEQAESELTSYDVWKAWQAGTEYEKRLRYNALIKARTREILEENIGDDLIASSSQMGRVFALNSDPVGFGALAHGAIQKLSFGKYGTGLAFSRAAINMAAAASNYAPVMGWINFFRSSSLAGKFLALKWDRKAGDEDSRLPKTFSHAFDLRSGPDALTPERASAIQIQATMGAVMMGMLWTKFDDDEDDAWEIHGSMRYLSRGQRSTLLTAGAKPYSIRIGDAYYSFKNTPMAGVLAGFGRLQDERRYKGKSRESVADKLMGMSMHGYAFTFDVGPASHFTRLLDALMAKNEDHSRQQILQTLFQGWTGPIMSPNLFREMDTWLDDKHYRPGKADYMTPMWSQLVVIPGVVSPRKWKMKPMLNLLGEPVEIRRSPEERFVKFANEDPVWRALAAQSLNGVFLPASRTGELVTADGEIRDMTPDEQYLYQQKAGQAMRVELERDLAWFRSAHPEDAKRYIDRMSGSIKKRVRIEMGRTAR